jgi:hypothetical protein
MHVNRHSTVFFVIKKWKKGFTAWTARPNCELSLGEREHRAGGGSKRRKTGDLRPSTRSINKI